MIHVRAAANRFIHSLSIESDLDGSITAEING